MKRPKLIAILQSNYIPWKGYFDIIAAADLFLIFDEAQFTRRDWRNRNRIVINGRPHWLTIPVSSKGHFDAPINEITTADGDWAEKHWRSIALAYGKAEFFDLYANPLREAYEAASKLRLLTQINEFLLLRLAPLLSVEARFGRTDAVPRKASTPTERLVEICVAHGAEAYLSGPAAKAYIDTRLFEDAGVKLHYADYSGYPVYDQKSETFEHGVSIIDLLMRCGPQAREHLKSSQRRDGLFAASASAG